MTDFVSSWNSDSFLTYPVGPLGLIAMPGTEEIGEKVNNWLKKWRDHAEESEPGDMRTSPGMERQDFLIKVSCPRFGNGEAKGMIRESIRGYDMYILVDPGAYNVTYEMFGREVPMSPDEHFANLKRIIAAMSGKAKRVTVIMPMLYEARQHRRASRESLDCAMALQELVAMGVSNIITFDAHDPRVQNAIPNAGFESVMPSYQIFKALLRNNRTLKIDREHMMIVSPDEGAIDRNIFYASVLGLDMGLFYKRRDYTRVVNGRNPIVAHEYLGDSVEGKDILLIDDMINSGNTMLSTAEKLKNNGAANIYCLAPYGLFTDGLDVFDKAYKSGLISAVCCTNLIYRSPELLKRDWYVDANMVPYVARIIEALNLDESIYDLINSTSRLTDLVSQIRIGEVFDEFDE